MKKLKKTSPRRKIPAYVYPAKVKSPTGQPVKRVKC